MNMLLVTVEPNQHFTRLRLKLWSTETKTLQDEANVAYGEETARQYAQWALDFGEDIYGLSMSGFTLIHKARLP